VAIKLRHPNIAHLYDFTTDEDGTAIIVMEFIPGKTLEEILAATGPPPLGLTLEIAHQSLRALGYLHSKGFIHRDISPDNLMLTEDPDGNPQIKMIDLGIAKILGGAEAHLTQTGAFLGKIRYASPEQFGSEAGAVADARGDIYSFGVVLYEMLTGAYPITGRDTSSLIAGHLFRAPVSFDETDRRGIVPPGLRAAVLRTLAKNPDDRYASAQELAGELARFRVPHDLPADEWKQLLAAVASTAETQERPGTTQDRLDEHFQLGPAPTPAPQSEPAGILIPFGRGEGTLKLREPGAQASAPSEMTKRLLPVATEPPAAPSESRSERGGPARKRIAGAVLALAILSGATWFLTHRRAPQPATAPVAAPVASPLAVTPAPAPSSPAPAPSGTVRVDALPWGEVIEIRDGHGTSLPVPASAITPLVLTLPAGRYAIRLRNPSFAESITVSAEVPLGAGVSSPAVVGEFRRVDVDEYLKGMGW
jgi:serine/threonine-protein kinase